MVVAAENLFSSFVSSRLLPTGNDQIRVTLQSPYISKIICFALGPKGNNIEQACEQWTDQTKIRYKTEVVLCDTPVICLKRAQEIKDDGALAIFWTCAVYYDLHNLFFTNPDVLPFFISHTMNLDEMQLATRLENLPDFSADPLFPYCRIATHPSPAPLIRNIDCERVKADSNAHAAKLCASGDVDACITTETARKIYRLEKVHSFGSPPMVFFGGITAHGAKLVRLTYSTL